MARDFAKVKVSIWSDPDFVRLPMDAQHAYFVLFSQPKLNYCGVLDYLPNRLATLSVDHNGASLDESVKQLEADQYVVVDRDTSELLVRSFIRHDGLLSSPNMTKALLKDYATVISQPLREVIARELGKCYANDKAMGGWKVIKNLEPNLWAKVSANPSAKGFGKGSANLGGKVA